MYKNVQIKMNTIVHFFDILFMGGYNMNVQLIQQLDYFKTMNMKPNYSELSRQYGYDRRTIKKYDSGYQGKPLSRQKSSMLDVYKNEIEVKLAIPGTTAKAIYEFLKAQGKDVGSESNFRKYVANIRKEKYKPKGVMRYETPPGKQAQVDWKEDVKYISKHGEIIEGNIFVYILSSSRAKYIEFTQSRDQRTLFQCMHRAFEYTGGVPESVLFDNMSTVSNHTSRNGSRINEKLKAFAKDYGFKVKRCKPYRPQTKGKVESANRYMNWLKPYNHEFEDLDHFHHIVKRLNISLNQEVSQTTNIAPILLLQKEKEHLSPLPAQEIINHYIETSPPRKVSKDSMISYKGNKYSVPNEFIGKNVTIDILDDKLHIYYNADCIRIHVISKNKLNYHEEDYRQLVCQTFGTDDDIETITKQNLEFLDNL